MPDSFDKPWNWSPLEERPRRAIDPQDEIRARKAAIGQKFRDTFRQPRPQIDRIDDDKTR